MGFRVLEFLGWVTGFLGFRGLYRVGLGFWVRVLGFRSLSSGFMALRPFGLRAEGVWLQIGCFGPKRKDQRFREVASNIGTFNS